MAEYIYTMMGVSKTVPPNREIIKDISLSFFPGAKIGVLGLNGAGKSTVLRIMAGIDQEYNGEARAQPGINIGYLPQEPELEEDKTVRENVEAGMGEVKSLLTEFDEISTKFAEPMSDDEMNDLLARQAELQEKIDASNGWDLDRTMNMAADALRLPPWDATVKNLSGGEKRRVALCKLLLSSPDMLLLDEPTNHLDAETVAWLERYLHDFKGTIVAVTHDRYFLDNAAEWILELDRGHGIPWKGNYSSWLEQKEKRLEQEAKQEQSHMKTIKHELEWVRSNPKGRRAKSKARLRQFEELQSKDFQKRNETNQIYIPPGPRLGELVIEFDHVSKAFGDKYLIDDLSFKVPQGAIVGIIGPNGAGKTTLFNMINGTEQPDEGSITVGPTVELAYVSQSREDLNSDKQLWQEVADGEEVIKVGNYSVPARAWLSRFNFKGADQQKLVKHLSGGERNRLQLAKVLKIGGNVLMLDEPTNDLDVETLRALEEAILNFAGSALIISHDRWFLDRAATHILAFENNSQVEFFEGNYSEYEQDYKSRHGKTLQPERVKYRPLKK
ncbi:energy-dependent translational throttle protein EttA [Marinicella pacifica]|uniref:Energy-dependent translational throttle protein EttA n=1 Tax=Marinicella pacifica TaxID=1171543 RepID=A0A917FN40_9GAMM|nr:energy-dependent translational throttle protein EttA [Marinicella pacifica]GGF95010.1 energy-dependent translational throttle protein EttA [Marinicella pacifica]